MVEIWSQFYRVQLSERDNITTTYAHLLSNAFRLIHQVVHYSRYEEKVEHGSEKE